MGNEVNVRFSMGVRMMRLGRKRGTVVLLLVVGLLAAHASPALAAVGAVRLQGADRYETCAVTALQAC